MDQDSVSNVRLGVWTNKSRGPILGATLTVTKQDANLLISFMAFFIGYIGTRFWRIVCIILHWSHSKSGPMDAIYHQRQVILRNAASAESALASLIRVSGAWRHAKTKSSFRILPEFALAICCLCAFVVAGGFSGRILTAIGDEVLLDGTNCSVLKFTRPGRDFYLAWVIGTISTAINYALNCYSSIIASSSLACNTYVVKQLPTAVTNATAPCPFEENICRSNTSNILLDTGFLDSNDHFGLNFDTGNRILFRKVFHCAPLITEGHDTSFKRSGFNYTHYDYGNQIALNLNYTLTELNYTFEVQDRESQYREDYDKLGNFIGGNFLVDSMYSEVINRTISPGIGLIPVPGLRRADADMSVIFLSGNGVVFNEPTHDDWYRGNVPCQKLIDTDNKRIIQYCPEDAASPIACLEQFQVCNGKESRCGPLASFHDAWREAAEAFGVTQSEMMESRDGVFVNEAASRLAWFLLILDSYPTRLTELINFAGSESLSSRHYLSNGVQRRLPKNQWQLDVIHWWSTTLALTQAAFVEAAGGIIDPNLVPYRVFPKNEVQREMCRNQKITSSDHDSFSLFGILFTFVTGFIIIITSYALEPFLQYLHQHYRYKQYSHLEWASNGTLQLQRLAHEGSGSQDWTRCDEEVPITDPGSHLACLDISDLGHPRLCYPKPPNGTDSGSEQGGRLSSDTIDIDDEISNITDNQHQDLTTPNVIENNDYDGELNESEHEEIELWGPLRIHGSP